MTGDFGLLLDLSVPSDLGGAPTDLGVFSDLAMSADLSMPREIDAGELPGRVSLSPDGLGYCCEPIRAGNCGSPSFYHGGYGVTPIDCLGYWTDAIWIPTTLEFVDEHGCIYLDLATAMSCLPPRPDAGPGAFDAAP